MGEDPKSDVTAILAELPWDATSPGKAAEELLPLVYDELRRLARHHLRREPANQSLRATALVHEAYERLAVQSRVDWRGRSHFLAVAAQMMRRVLIDHARLRSRLKRGGGQRRVTLEGLAGSPGGSDLDLMELMALDQALTRLASFDARAAQIVEMRFFAGMTTNEIARFMSVSERTVRNDWAHARAWLKEEISREGGA